VLIIDYRIGSFMIPFFYIEKVFQFFTFYGKSRTYYWNDSIVGPPQNVKN